jgi:hypothetical protein
MVKLPMTIGTQGHQVINCIYYRQRSIICKFLDGFDMANFEVFYVTAP